MSNKCRDCIQVESEDIRGKRIQHCIKRRWDGEPPALWGNWYAESTVMRNRLPVKAYGADCPDFERRS